MPYYHEESDVTLRVHTKPEPRNTGFHVRICASVDVPIRVRGGMYRALYQRELKSLRDSQFKTRQIRHHGSIRYQLVMSGPDVDEAIAMLEMMAEECCSCPEIFTIVADHLSKGRHSVVLEAYSPCEDEEGIFCDVCGLHYPSDEPCPMH